MSTLVVSALLFAIFILFMTLFGAYFLQQKDRGAVLEAQYLAQWNRLSLEEKRNWLRIRDRRFHQAPVDTVQFLERNENTFFHSHLFQSYGYEKIDPTFYNSQSEENLSNLFTEYFNLCEQVYFYQQRSRGFSIVQTELDSIFQEVERNRSQKISG